ncbi:vestitone reductase-like [Forsythia ovata]|uniref:Vestitone reductase-like n=1 Tax=Forsythia ovata TaxID=205694 RepID=A0ABD1VGR8_9LAMI
MADLKASSTSHSCTEEDALLLAIATGYSETSRKTLVTSKTCPVHERLRIFRADHLDKPDSFDSAIKGCIGVFHVAHLADKETEETKINKSVNGTLGILQACLGSKTVKRVVYNSGVATGSTWKQKEFNHA